MDRFKPPKNGSQKGNPLNGLFGGTQSFSGQGQSLGGTQPGRIVPITLSDPGTLGIQLEKHKGPRKTSIVANVVPQSQAETAGLQRGDVLCFAGSNGQEEILYDMFLELASSTQRPLHFEARRVPEVKTPAAAAKGSSAQDYARRQAVIAAAEKREKAHKQKTKPIPKVSKDSLPKLLSTAEKQKLEQERQERIQQQSNAPLSAATQQALQQAKSAEARTSAELGYNPYAVKNMTSGQARNAVTATTHGTIQAEGASKEEVGGPGTVRPPPSTPSTTNDATPPSPGFESAFETMVTSGTEHAQVVASLSILERLITNAITKQHDVKFRKVRLANPKIQAAVAAVPGAVDVLLETGFVLRTDDATNESILLHEGDTPVWWKSAVRHMERYRLEGGNM